MNSEQKVAMFTRMKYPPERVMSLAHTDTFFSFVLLHYLAMENHHGGLTPQEAFVYLKEPVLKVTDSITMGMLSTIIVRRHEDGGLVLPTLIRRWQNGTLKEIDYKPFVPLTFSGNETVIIQNKSTGDKQLFSRTPMDDGYKSEVIETVLSRNEKNMLQFSVPQYILYLQQALR